MAINSFDTLSARIAQYLKRQDLAALIPDFISLAEETFDKTIYTKDRRVSYIFTPMQDVNSLPSDWRRVIEVYMFGKLLDFFPDDFNSQHIRHGYQIQGNQIIFAVPQLGLTRIDYYQTLEALSDSNESNWLLESSPSCYLYGTLCQAAIYMRDDARLAQWSGLLDLAISNLSDDDELTQRPESTLVMRAG